jgi:hypothetical protein
MVARTYNLMEESNTKKPVSAFRVKERWDFFHPRVFNMQGFDVREGIEEENSRCAKAQQTT